MADAVSEGQLEMGLAKTAAIECHRMLRGGLHNNELHSAE